MGTKIPPPGDWTDLGVKCTTDLQLVPRLRISGTIPPLPVCAVMACETFVSDQSWYYITSQHSTRFPVVPCLFIAFGWALWLLLHVWVQTGGWQGERRGGAESITYPILAVATAVINYPYPTEPVSQRCPSLFIWCSVRRSQQLHLESLWTEYGARVPVSQVLDSLRVG